MGWVLQAVPHQSGKTTPFPIKGHVGQSFSKALLLGCSLWFSPEARGLQGGVGGLFSGPGAPERLSEWDLLNLGVLCKREILILT